MPVNTRLTSNQIAARPCWGAQTQVVHLKRRRHLHKAKAGGGGLFGGLKGLSHGDGREQSQQEQQAASTSQSTRRQQQQQQPQLQRAVGRPGTPAAPEFPPFKTIKSWKQGGPYDLRLYDVYPVIEMNYERREQGYLALGSYQDGANEAGSKFGFTQPIVMSYHPEGHKVMQMMVGTQKDSATASSSSSSSSSNVTSLPVPTDPEVRLGVSGGELVAVLYFDGYITPQTAEAARSRLSKALKADGIGLAEPESAGFFRVGQYGAVHTLEQRVNEMLLRVNV